MPKSTTKSFITEIAIKTGSYEQSILQKRFWAAKQQYNTLLSEALKRPKNMRADLQYRQVRELYKQEGKKTEAQTLYKKIAETHQYRAYDLYAYCRKWNQKKYFLSIGARISQQLAKRAFNATEEYRTGERGKPCFKGHKGISSIDANLRLKNHYLACFVENNTLMADQAQEALSGMDIALRTAMHEIKRSSSEHLPACLRLSGAFREERYQNFSIKILTLFNGL